MTEHRTPVLLRPVAAVWDGLGFQIRAVLAVPLRERGKWGCTFQGADTFAHFSGAVLSPALLQNSTLYPQSYVPGTCWEERHSRLVRTARGWEQ